MGFNTFGPLLVVDAQLTPAAGVVGTVVDATTMEPVTTYSMSGTPMSLVTNARGYVGQFQAPDTSVMLRLMFGDLALDVVAKEAIASGGGAVTSVDGKTGAVSLSDTYAPLPTDDQNYVSDAQLAALHTHPAVIAQGATQADARSAIGAGTSSFSGAYTDLSGKPSLFSGSYTDLTNKPTIPDSADDIGAAPATQTLNAQTDAYTLVAGDAGKIVTMSKTAAMDLTIPKDVFSAGQRVDVLVINTGMVTVKGATDVTVTGTPSLVSRAQWSALTVICTASNTFVAVGDLATP